MTVTTYQTVTIPAEQLGSHVMLVEWLLKQQQQLSVQQRLIDQQQQLIDQQKQQIFAQHQEIENLKEGNCSPQQESIIEKHYKQHQLRKKKRMLKMDW